MTSFEFRLHPVATVYGGADVLRADDAGDRAALLPRVHRRRRPEELGAFPAFQIAPPLPFIPEERHGDTFIAIVACWAGPRREGERALEPIRDVAPWWPSSSGPMPYAALNSAFDALVPPGLQHYWKANFVDELTDEAIAAHLEHGPKVPAVNSTMHIYPINGAVPRVGAGRTAFAYRDANFATVIAGMWPDPADNEANTDWVRDYYEATAPESEEGGYINFMSGDDQERIRANYRGNYDRLVDVKRKYDPDNLFHVNQNISPTGDRAWGEAASVEAWRPRRERVGRLEGLGRGGCAASSQPSPLARRDASGGGGGLWPPRDNCSISGGCPRSADGKAKAAAR